MRKLLSEFIIVWFCLASITGCARTLKLEPFTNDGCTFFPNSSFNSDTDWSGCCLEHDMAYWQGGTEEERWMTDQVFRDCIIRETNNEMLADLMYDAVRIGDTPHFPSWYRWGYGWKYGRGYGPLSEEEKELVRMGLDEYHRGGNNDAMDTAAD